MQGLRAIHQLNRQRAFEAVQNAEAKAAEARKQNHPRADALAAHASALRKEYDLH
jgi:hypothetical protein